MKRAMSQRKRARSVQAKRAAQNAPTHTSPPDAPSVLARLKRMGSKRARDGMARYGIPSDNAFGIPVGDLQRLSKELGRDHALAQSLWETGIYEARMLASMVAEPARVTPAQMDRWCADFDSWAIVDTVCFKLWDQTPHWPDKAAAWSKRKPEFEKRAAFALIASAALHDKARPDAAFTKLIPLIARAASDERNFVKKGVSWALRGIGHRSAALHTAAVDLAKKLSASKNSTERWVGKDALKDLTRPAVARRFAKRR
jgi:3-methyladenine DNA glycosylase AlkD